MVSVGGLLVAVGLAVLMHTTFGVINYREQLKLLQEEFEALPMALLGELAIGAVVTTIGAYLLSGTLRSIQFTKPVRMTDIGGLRTDFVSFNLRSKAFPLNIQPLK